LEQYIREHHPDVVENLTISNTEAEISNEIETDHVMSFAQLCHRRHWDIWDQSIDGK
jgi:hypothetical protein